MAQESLRIPQIGEGLQEARVVAFLKQPGDTVRRDEPIYQMETDKAVMDVESPVAGTLVRWLANVDDVLPIGAEVGLIESTEAIAAPSHAPAAAAPAAQPASGPSEVSLRIPQIGEGLQEARLVAKLKQVGDTIRRDEAIYQMETDKAVMDVECPYSGTVVRWLAEVDDVLPIGAEVLVLSTEDAAGEAPAAHGHAPASAAPAAPATVPAASTGERRRDIPPRTRAHAKKLGLTDAQLESIPAAGSKLMPEDVDAFLAGGSSAPAPAAPQPAAAKEGPGTDAKGRTYNERAFGGKQRVLSSRLVRGNQMVVPGMMSVVAHWGAIESLRQSYKDQGGDFQPSTFTLFAFAVAKAAADHPIVRSTLVGESVRTYNHIQLGIAVALPGDELVVAVVPNADSLDWRTFAQTTREKIELARNGTDQADESVTLSITNMSGHGIREAMAVVVPPGVATIFLGEPYNGLAQDTTELKLQRQANIGITLDHRLINGVGGAEFLNAIKRNVENIHDLVK